MTAKKFYFIMIGLLALSIAGAIAMLYFGNSLMQKNANKLVNAKLSNVSADTEEQSYLNARKDLEKYSSLNATIQKILPKSKDQAQAVKELYQIGDETGIVIDKIQFPTSTLGQKTATTSSTATTASSAASVVTQAQPVTGMPGVLGIDIEIGLLPASGKSISYDNMIKFLQNVEANRRSMQIKNISVQADTQNGGITFDATLTIFIKP
ncbi:MAG TPA: hypothetical protein VMR51_00640 [Patescibacteria group bacterium]|nr:hypothetical protein [Patescibacteria group bacterium]